jgi:hypothetical protein
LGGGEDLLLQAERNDGGRDTDLGGRDQGSRHALVAQPGGEQVDRDIEDEQGDGESQDRRMVDQRTELQPGPEDDEEERYEEPVGEPAPGPTATVRAGFSPVDAQRRCVSER